MKKLLTILPISLIYFLSAVPALAACSVNGEEIPCSQFQAQYGWIFGVMMTFWAVMMVFWLVMMGFWVWMLIDCLKRDFKDKTIWVLVLIFTTVLGAILYYFMVKRKKSELPHTVKNH